MLLQLGVSLAPAKWSLADALDTEDVKKKIKGEKATQYTTDEFKFGGVRGWLDLEERATPMGELGVG